MKLPNKNGIIFNLFFLEDPGWGTSRNFVWLCNTRRRSQTKSMIWTEDGRNWTKKTLSVIPRAFSKIKP